MAKKSLDLIVNTDRDLIAREVPSQRVLEIAVQAPDASSQTARPRLNLALVLDRSGSMSGEKLEYVKQAAIYVLDMLQERDQVTLVVFDDQINLLSPTVPVTAQNRNNLKERISSVQSGGSTNLSDGWLAGCKEIADHIENGTINRALLLTDGQANAGITDPDELAKHARELSARGISTSTFGVGMGFNEHLLEAMSNQGNGSFYYIRTPSQIPDLFAREFKELAAITARDIKLVLTLPAQADATVLGGWRFEKGSGKLHIDLIDLYAGRKQEVYVKLLTPPSTGQSQLVVQVHLTAFGEAGESHTASADVVFQYVGLNESEAAPRHVEMLQRYAGVDLAETAGEALKLERMGEKDKASRVLKQSLEAHRPYLDSDKAGEYERMSDRMKHGMDEADLKESHLRTYAQKRRREP